MAARASAPESAARRASPECRGNTFIFRATSQPVTPTNLLCKCLNNNNELGAHRMPPPTH